MLTSTLMTAGGGAGWRRFRTPLVLALITAVGGALRLWGLGERSLWGDELYVLDVVQRGPLALIWPELVDRGNMLLFYCVASVWTQALPVSMPPNEFAIRLLPVLFSLATIPALYLLGDQLAKSYLPRVSARRVGLFAATFYALSPFAVRYAQEFRAYSLQVLLLTLAALSLVTALKRVAEHRNSMRWWSAFAVLSSLAMYAHFLGVLTVATQLAGLLVLLLVQRAPARLRGLAVASAIVVATTAPLVLTAVHSGWRGLNWIEPLTLFSVVRTVGFFLGTSVGTGGTVGLLLPAALAVPIALVLGVALQYTLKQTHLRAESYILIHATAAVPLLVGIGVSILARPIWVDRYFMQVLIPTSIAFAVGAALLTRTSRSAFRLPLLLVGASAICLTVSSAIRLQTYKTEDWKVVAATIEERCPSATTMRIGYSAASPQLKRGLDSYGITVDGVRATTDLPAIAVGKSLCLLVIPGRDEAAFSQYLARLTASIGPLTEYPGTPTVYRFQSVTP